LGHNLADFFTNSSGHPDSRWKAVCIYINISKRVSPKSDFSRSKAAVWIKSHDRELQRQRSKNLQRHK
jgi:hypothetical protein